MCYVNLTKTEHNIESIDTFNCGTPTTLFCHPVPDLEEIRYLMCNRMYVLSINKR